MAVIPARVWELLTEDERVRLQEVLDGWRYQPNIVCPCCQTALGVRLKITAGAIVLETEPPPPVKPQLGAKDKELLDAAKSTGIFEVFSHAVREAMQYMGVPSDMEAHFLRFWARLIEVSVPRAAMATWITEFGGYIRVYSSDDILLVTSDGIAKQFVPNRFVRASHSTKNDDPQIVPRSAHFERWVKGKFGYVPAGANRFTDALRQRNIGAFGRVVQ